MDEAWLPIPGHEGRYDVSSEGRVRSLLLLDPVVLSQRVRRRYLSVNLRMLDGKPRDFSVHRLVALAFLGQPNELYVNHKSGVRTDNRASNLEYCTHSQNMKHAFAMGLQCNKGERHSMAKLTEEQVNQIRRVVAQGETQANVALRMGIHQSAVSRIVNNKRWQHVTNDRKVG